MQCFYCPVVRHLWWWLGGRPASAATMHALLNKGSCVLVCPGGVRECLHMEKGREAILLHGRTGFVRIAMQHGGFHGGVAPCAVGVGAESPLAHIHGRSEILGHVLWQANPRL